MIFLFADMAAPKGEHDNDKCMALHCENLLYTRAAIIGRGTPRFVLSSGFVTAGENVG